jgi:hypothetical protein
MGEGNLVTPPPPAGDVEGRVLLLGARGQRQLCQVEHAHVPVPSTLRLLLVPSAVLLLPSAALHSVVELPPWCRGSRVIVGRHSAPVVGG